MSVVERIIDHPETLAQAVEHLAQAGQSISALAEYLQRHPNALLTGRENPKVKP